MPDDRPNVLLIMTDQQSANAMSCAGNDELHTPNLDRLADRGTRFAETYCADPLCTPSRASIFTGRYPHEVGVTGNNAGIDPEFRDQELGTLFEAAGYDTAYGGKWHVPEFPIPEGHGFEQICGFNDLELADACVDFLERDRGDPFFLVASFDDPHGICEWSREQTLPWGNVPRVPVEECPSLPANFPVPPFEPDFIRPTLDQSRAVHGAMVGRPDTEWRHYRHAYFRLVERVDAYVGEILDALEAEGLAEDTLVVFTSDHGDGQGAHQLKEKSWLYEEQTRVPLVVSYPGETREGAVDDHLVSNGLDLLPTLCDYAGIDPPDDLRGRSLRDLAAGRDVEDWRDHLVVETYGPIEGRMVRTEQYKYVVYERGRNREQLFDLDADRGEMVDLSVNAEYDAVLDAHRELLLEWCVATRDQFGNFNDYPAVPRVPGYEYAELREQFVPGGYDPDDDREPPDVWGN